MDEKAAIASFFENCSIPFSKSSKQEFYPFPILGGISRWKAQYKIFAEFLRKSAFYCFTLRSFAL